MAKFVHECYGCELIKTDGWYIAARESTQGYDEVTSWNRSRVSRVGRGGNLMCCYAVAENCLSTRASKSSWRVLDRIESRPVVAFHVARRVNIACAEIDRLWQYLCFA